MQETIKINDLTLCHKHSDGWVRSTLPDVCKSPQVPVPYVNMAFAKDLADGTTTVRSHGGAMNGVKGSRFAVSIGDEPGVGGGVISGVNKHEATWLSWSPNVFMEGRPVTRLTDKMLMNKGNTVSIGGYYTKKPKNEKAKPLLDAICEAACQCLRDTGSTKGTCVEDKVLTWAAVNGQTVITEIAWDQIPTNDPKTPNWEIRKRDDGTILSGGGKRPIDFIDFNNKIAAEYKGLGDRMRGRQSDNIDNIADQHGLIRDDVDLNKGDCACDDGTELPVAAPAKDPADAKDRLGQFAYNDPWWTAGAVAAGVVVIGAAVFLGGPAAVALLAGGTLTAAAQ